MLSTTYTVNPLRFRQLAHTRRTNPRPAGPRPLANLVLGARVGKPFRITAKIHFAPEYTENVMDKRHTRHVHRADCLRDTL